jgi:hypothetical protein
MHLPRNSHVPATTTPLYTTPIDTHEKGMPWMKFVVPSMGSTTNTGMSSRSASSTAAADASDPAATPSSPSIANGSPRSRVTVALIVASHSLSISVTRSLGLDFSAATLTLPACRRMSRAAASPASTATSRHRSQRSTIQGMAVDGHLRGGWGVGGGGRHRSVREAGWQGCSAALRGPGEPAFEAVHPSPSPGPPTPPPPVDVDPFLWPIDPTVQPTVVKKNTNPASS